MAEATGLPGKAEELQAAFARIEAAVDAGDTDLGKLGFWRALREVKLDAALSEHWADVSGRIDRLAFENGVSRRFKVWFGNLVLLVETVLGAAVVVLAMRTSNATLAGLSLLAAAVAWSVSLHCLAHWLFGRLVGIRFLWYSLGGRPPRPGLKIDYATYLRAAPGERAWMHASGALATKVAPFIALAFWWGTDAPVWAAWAVGGLGVFQILTDVFLSTKTSDWKKVKRERAIARAQVARRV